MLYFSSSNLVITNYCIVNIGVCQGVGQKFCRCQCKGQELADTPPRRRRQQPPEMCRSVPSLKDLARDNNNYYNIIVLLLLLLLLYMLWFKFILGLMFFVLVSILFAIVPVYGNEYMTKENKN